MVARILDAATRVLVESGYERASTNRIAAEAGVSTGSLYQYFPNKDAVLIEVVNAYLDGLERDLARRVTDSFNEPPRDYVRHNLEALLSALEANVEILRAVTDNLPRNGEVDVAFQERLVDISRSYLMANRAIQRAANIDAAAWIIVQAAVHLTTRYVLDRPAISREEFLAELTTLELRYLKR